jgi:hypothetical protein
MIRTVSVGLFALVILMAVAGCGGGTTSSNEAAREHAFLPPASRFNAMIRQAGCPERRVAKWERHFAAPEFAKWPSSRPVVRPFCASPIVIRNWPRD